MSDWQTKSSKIVYENPWITIHEDQTIMPSGNEGIYGYMESRDSVMVVPMDDQKRVFLEKAFRYPSKSQGWECPGGGGDNEDLIDASKRELEEETGIRVENIEKLGSTIVCNGLMTERQTSCIAWGLHFDGEREKSDEVFEDQRFFTWEEIDLMIDSGDINDNQTLTALYLAKRWLDKHHNTTGSTTI
ncbi:MAG TPA: NUDIX hydrolase [Candidatus Saccharimonadaceae bacterium]|nr:NUDIX hydrolase [Candidatus Saccharimonadaceae bacterium]